MSSSDRSGSESPPPPPPPPPLEPTQFQNQNQQPQFTLLSPPQQQPQQPQQQQPQHQQPQQQQQPQFTLLNPSSSPSQSPPQQQPHPPPPLQQQNSLSTSSTTPFTPQPLQLNPSTNSNPSPHDSPSPQPQPHRLLTIQPPQHSSNHSLPQQTPKSNSTTQQQQPYKPTITDFTLHHVVGEGAYAKVYFSQNNKTNSFYALKMVDKDHVTRVGKIETVTTERNVLTTLKGHPGVINLQYTLQDNYSLYFAVEFCLGGELYDQIKHFKTLPLETVRFYAAELLETIHFLHLKNILHRDLKPSNILLTESGHLKLCDFGTAKILQGNEKHIPLKLIQQLEKLDLNDPNQTTTEHNDDDEFDFDAALAARNGNQRKESFVGTALYCNPEMLSSHYLTFGTDWWSFGVILYEMICGITPFQAESEYLTFQKIQSKEPLTFPPSFDPIARDLIEKLLHPDPRQRLGTKYEQEREIFQHAFFKPIWNQCRTEAIQQLLHKDKESTQPPSEPTTPMNQHQHQRGSVFPSQTTNHEQLQLEQIPRSKMNPNELDTNSDEYKQLWKMIKPLSIFSLTPPTYWINETVVNPNKILIQAARQKRQEEREKRSSLATSPSFSKQQSTSISLFTPNSSLNNNTSQNISNSYQSSPNMGATLRPSQNQSQNISNSQRGSIPLATPPLQQRPSLNTPGYYSLESPQTPLSRSLNMPSTPTNSNGIILQPLTLPQLSLTTTTTATPSNSGGNNNNTNSNNNVVNTTDQPTQGSQTPSQRPMQQRQYGGYGDQSSDEEEMNNNVHNTAISKHRQSVTGSQNNKTLHSQPRLLNNDDSDEEDDEIDENLDFGLTITKSSSNLQSLRSPGENRLLTPASPLPGGSSILSAVVGQPEYKQYLTSVVPDPQFQQDKWEPHLKHGEYIVAVGLISKNSRWSSTFFVKKRQLLLTSQARLIYIDEQKNIMKGEINIIGDGYHFKLVDNKNFEVTCTDDDKRVFKISCHQAPSIVSWFIKPHREAAPKVLPPGEPAPTNEKFTYLYSTENRFADQWRWLLDTTIQFQKQGGVLKRTGEIYTRQKHIDEQLGNRGLDGGPDGRQSGYFASSTSNLHMASPQSTTGSLRSTGGRDTGTSSGQSRHPPRGDQHRDGHSRTHNDPQRHSVRTSDGHHGERRPKGERQTGGHSRSVTQRGSLRQQIDAQKVGTGLLGTGIPKR